MQRTIGAAALLVVTTLTAHAHFVWVLPDPKDPATALVIFSDDLAPDEAVGTEKLSPINLTCRDETGKDATVEHKAGDHVLTATIPGSGPRIIFGTLDYGVMQKGESKPYLLTYHPKAVVGTVGADKMVLGEKVVPVEIVPVISGSEVKFRFLSAGKRWRAPRLRSSSQRGARTRSRPTRMG